MKKINEAVTFIKASREEAITLANDIVGDAEVHALYIQKGFIVSPQPVGYMVVPYDTPPAAQPEQEPVAWMVYTMDGQSAYVTDNSTDIKSGQQALPLYTAPQRREWVGLTGPEVDEAYGLVSDKEWAIGGLDDARVFFCVIESKLKDKNGG